MNRLRLFGSLFLVVLVAVNSVLGQANVNEEQGLKPYDSIHGGDLDTVSLTNGGLALHIPLAAFPQRGNLDLSFSLQYSSKQWQVKTTCVGQSCTSKWQPARGISGARIASSLDWWTQRTITLDPSYIETVSSPDGNLHQIGGSSSSATALYPAYSLDASGVLRPDGNTLIMANGTHYSYVNGLGSSLIAGIQPTSVTDANGNQITIGSSGWTDTLGRVIPGYSNGSGDQVHPGVSTSDLSNCPSGTSSATIWNVPGVTGVNNGTRTFKFCYSTVTLSTNFQQGGVTEFPATSTSLLTAIVLPNLTMWTLTYDSYGDVTSLGFPTGGSISYTYATRPTPVCSPTWTATSRWVTSRTVNANDGTGEHTWNYTYTSTTTTVTSPDGNDTVHTIGTPVASAYCSLYDTEVQYYQGSASSGTLLKTVFTQYSSSAALYSANDQALAINVVPSQVTTTWPSGHTSKTITTYDTGGNDSNGNPYIFGSVLEKGEYDFSNSLVRSTFNHYLWQDNATYKSNNFLNLLVSTTVKDGSGNQMAQTTYGTDQTTPLTSGISTGHGSPPAGGNSRGNVTTASHWLNTTNSSISGTATYFDTGMKASSTDPKNTTTTYSYSSSFAGAYMTQTNLPDTQMPDQGAPIVHHVISGNYDFNTGLLTSFTDENSQNFTYTYDVMLRLTQGNHPDGGQAIFTYPDPNTVTRQRLISSGNYEGLYTAKFDGLGRSYQTLQATPSGTVEIDTTYDSVGRESTISNPYYQGSNHSSDPTYGVVTTQYDALSRATQVTKQDGSMTVALYNQSAAVSSNADCTMTTDEAGRQRRVCNDALGRLIEVDEPLATGAPASATASVTLSGGLASVQTSAPPPAAAGSGLAGFADPSGNQHWAYLGGNQHLYNLYWNGSTYSFDDVTAASGAPVAAGTAMTGFPDGSDLWAYLGSNGHVYNLYWNSCCGYGYQDATSASGAPAAASGSPVIGFADSSGGQHWAFIGTNQHVYNIYWNSCCGYGYGDVTAIVGAPAAASGSALSAFGDPSGGQHWAYFGTNQHLYHIWWTSSSGYTVGDANSLSGAPLASAGSALTGYADNSGGEHWSYLDANQHIYNLYLNGCCSYGWGDLTSATGSPAAVSGSAVAGFLDTSQGQHWAYLGTNQHVYNFYWNSCCGFGYQDATAGSGAPASNSGSAMVGFEDPSGGQHWAYFGTNQHVYNIWWNSGYGYQDVNAAADLVFDSGTVSLTLGSFTATACFGASTNSACTGHPNNTTASQVASALANAINVSSSPATATVSGSTINLIWKTPGPTSAQVSALSTTHDNSSLFPSPSFTSPSENFSVGVSAALNTPYVTLYTYDVLNNLTCIEQHGGVTGTGCSANPSSDSTSPWRVRRFTYDSLSRLLTSKNPEAGPITYIYDNNSNLTSKVEPAPNQTGSATVTVYHSYDALNRLLDTSYSDGTTAGVSHRYDYSTAWGAPISNPIGRLVETTAAGGSNGGYLMSYDQMGRVVRTYQGGPGGVCCPSFTATYDLLGDLTQVAYPANSFSVSYQYDSAARLIKATDSSNNVYAQTPTILASGAIQEFNATNFNNYKFHTDLNSRLQPTEIWAGTSQGLGAIFDKQYTYNLPNTSQTNNGNVYTVTNVKDSTRTQTFTYDVLNRLVSGQDGTHWSNTYAYDPWGNLQKIPGSLGGENFQHGADNYNHLAGFSYDAAGNMTNDGATSYTYDAENRIISSTTNSVTTNYVYDADGRRNKKSNSSNTTYYWYGPGGQIMGETDANTNWTNYVFFGGQRLARNISGDIKYYVTDHLHSTGMFIDKSGTVLDDNDFYPWGGVVPGVGQTTSTNHYKFTAKERDSETQLDYFGARYYANASGRWMSPDWAAKPVTVPYAEFGDPQSLNLYAYVRNSPIIRVDADGHNCVPMDTHVNTGGDGLPTDTTDELKMALEEALEEARARQNKETTPANGAKKPAHDASDLNALLNLAGAKDSHKRKTADGSPKLSKPCVGALNAAYPSFNYSRFIEISNNLQILPAKSMPAGMTQDDLVGNGSSTTLNNSVPYGANAVTLYGPRGTYILTGPNYDMESAVQQFFTRQHETIHAYTHWSDTEIFEHLAPFGLTRVNPGTGDITNWLMNGCPRRQ